MRRSRTMAPMLLCLTSAAAYGAMAVFGKLAYDEGATVGTLVALRFTFAAALLWAFGRTRAVALRDALAALALGAIGYAASAAAFFAALTRMDAGLASLLVYTFPAIVTVGAIVLGRERADRRRFAALALASLGLVGVLAGTASADALGVALAFAAALAYAGYVLAGQGLTARIDPLTLTALVCTGAALSATAGAAALGDLRPGELTLAGWGWIAALAVVCTVGAIGLFLAGVRRVGPSTASILATAEPVVTVLLAFAVFGETLSALQLLGAALVLAAVLIPRRGSAPRSRTRRAATSPSPA